MMKAPIAPPRLPLLVLLLCASRLRGAAAQHEISCTSTPDCDYANRATCAGCYADGGVERACASGEACVVTCSGPWACHSMTLDATAAASLDLRCSRGTACHSMTVRGPTAPGAGVDVRCEGSSYATCQFMQLHAAAAASARFSCGTTGGYGCGESAAIFCPGCDQDDAPDGGCAAAANNNGGGGAAAGACSVSSAHVRSLVPCAPPSAASVQVTAAPRAPP